MRLSETAPGERTGGTDVAESEFPKRLRRLREEQRKSRKIVSELCGLPSDAVRRYERGESKPTMDALIKIADHFEVSLDYLTGRINYR
ncbi:XRE family transcriptional regulator [Pseudoflavonifractor sp. 524-17]|nr:XRE family transcriptional regulator [Pseudoflavonifractor sp. 524-17]